MAFVIARAGVFAWLRRGRPGWVEFVSCPLCVGFWVGLGLGVARLVLSRFGGDPAGFWGVWQVSDVLDLVAGGALVGTTAFLYACVIDFLDALEQGAKRAFQTENRKLAAGHDVVGSGEQITTRLQALVKDLPPAPKAGDTVSLDAAFRRLIAERPSTDTPKSVVEALDLCPKQPDVVVDKEGESWPEKPSERP